MSTALALAAMAAPAHATISLSSFSLTPSTTQAGGSSSQPGPNLTLDATFSTTNRDTPKDATLALAPGVLANPSVVPLCSTQSFQSGHCPDASRIGHGYTTGTARDFGFTLSLPTDAYLIQPQGIEPARIGLIVTFFNYPVATESAPVTIRNSPNVGIDLPLTGLPNNLDGVRVIIDGLHLTIFGSVGGQSFTRNPTSCGLATSTLTVDSYGSSAQLTSGSPFTPTGCASLPYAPTIAGSVSKDAGDDGIRLDTTVTQQYGEADNRSIQLAFPFSASPRLSAFAAACTNADVTTCPSVGSATVTTPLLSAPLQARIVLVAHPGALPTAAILVPPPFGIEIDSDPILTGSSVQVVAFNIPDVPITSLVLDLPGGPNSLFRAGTQLCSSPQTWSGQFTAWSGATASPSAPATVTGCPGSPPSGPTPTGSNPTPPPPGQGPVIVGSGAPTATGTGLASYSHRHLTVAVGAGKRLHKLRSVTLRLPRGVRVLAASLDGRRARFVVKYAHGRLTITFDRSGRVAIIVLSSSRSQHRPRFATIRGTSGKEATVRLRP
jgi:hypothetical protein